MLSVVWNQTFKMQRHVEEFTVNTPAPFHRDLQTRILPLDHPRAREAITINQTFGLG